MPAREPYLYSQKRMAAVALTNLVYPVYTKRRYMRHNPPGKWWDSLYTWDPGFTGLGLAQLDVNRAIDCLNTYTTQPGDPAQERTLLGQLQSSERLWTPIGLSTVDQSAPYYRRDGYWNGAVRMPHQWFLWKTMLDLGQAEFAFKIAQTALDLCKKEVVESYHCFEHFLIESGRGAGWHQFSALSSPVLAWFAAYYRPGSLTVGFDTWIHRRAFAPDLSVLSAELELRPRPAAEATVLVTLSLGRSYRARWNGQPVPARTDPSGTLQISLPRTSDRGRLQEESANP